jgi:hypothetical protein
VRYALARAERQAGESDSISPWRRLIRLDGHYEPIYFLGAGRALLSRMDTDAASAEPKGRELLGRLGYWISQRIDAQSSRDPSDISNDPRQCFRPRRAHDFAEWWAVETQAELFGLQQIRGYDDLDDLHWLRDRAQTHVARLDRLEEELVARYASA